jgi:hypothetical protein
MSGVGSTAGRALPGKLAPRLDTLDGKRVGLLSTGKRNCDELLDEIGRLLGERFNLASIRSWRKPSVYKFSPLKRLRELSDACDAVVAGLGDCGHGSSCTLHDVYWLEEVGIPVAYVDTPGRTHKVWKEGDVFGMEYFSLKYVVRNLAKASTESRPTLQRKLFEKQGIYRALRLAGAKRGDKVRLLDTEFELNELPEPPKDWIPSSEGIPNYPSILTKAIGRLDEDGVRERAKELLPQVIEQLIGAQRP